MSERDLAKRVFRPGNLVHGSRLLRLPELIVNGLQIGRMIGKLHFTTPEAVCFALLPNLPLPQRYLEAEHYGPPNTEWHSGESAVGIIVDRLLLGDDQRLFLQAMGSYFWNPTLRAAFRELYNLKDGDENVLGFPIKPSYTSTFHGDEVRYTPPVDRSLPFTIKCWAGLVVDPTDYLWVKTTIGQHNLRIPIFSPECELLTE